MTQDETFPDTDASREALAREFYEISDGRKEGDLTALFDPDVEIFFPKFGILRGFDNYVTLRQWVRTFVRALAHQPDGFRVFHAGEAVIVEGTTRGETQADETWDGTVTVSGHFCSVFQIRGNRIYRMYVYLDPDYGNSTSVNYPPRES